ncbi:2'-5' RNA ligase family protein [Algoriphagus marinus]|uniref:2'-5' RNA ligase family protein n=1 Tax=Algoriphagus marinus TaxID=1925762 RepID=UPI00094BA438|nr:2'-5' RNA ligase family protein [Algoriphagus marinus]
MKVMQKYFLAIVPTGEIQESATSLKLLLKEQMNIKYALKSPAHITLKMPFSYNEAKEDFLIEKLSTFLSGKENFKLQVKGTGTFGRRVIFWRIEADSKLYELQESLKIFCKRELNLVDELSDRNFHPHMTIAFKDVKDRDFDQVLKIVETHSIDLCFQADRLALLKRKNGHWEVGNWFDLEKKV